jgi:hypothetical protein
VARRQAALSRSGEAGEEFTPEEFFQLLRSRRTEAEEFPAVRSIRGVFGLTLAPLFNIPSGNRYMGSLKKRRKAKINKHKRRKKLRANRHKKRTWQK